MRVLVTGAAGFVGRHMEARLIADDHVVTSIDLHPPDKGWAGFTRGAARICADARDVFRLMEANYDLIVHCAAVVGGRTMIDGDPLRLAAEDLSLDADLFRFVLRHKVPPKVVYFSSSAAYPVWLQDSTARSMFDPCGPLTESDIDLDDPALPDQTYGWVKLTGERLAAEANRMGIPVYVFRPFSGYGSDQDDTYPFPAFIDRALRREDPFTIWGHSGQVRDWIHIDDIVDAVMVRLDGDDTSPVNLCSGMGVPMIGLAGAVCAAVDYTPRFVTDESKPLGVMYRVGDDSKMRGFYRRKVTLADGIRRAIEERQ